ncbi:MAG: hypothetical protein KAT65_18725 [Methanophagales archaeon]|nr:hypothetical protein [Methanophagales archaeon]
MGNEKEQKELDRMRLCYGLYRDGLIDPRKYGRKVRELSMDEYKPWEIAKHLSMPANFTISYKLEEGKVEVWSIFPDLVEGAIKKSLESKH